MCVASFLSWRGPLWAKRVHLSPWKSTLGLRLVPCNQPLCSWFFDTSFQPWFSNAWQRQKGWHPRSFWPPCRSLVCHPLGGDLQGVLRKEVPSSLKLYKGTFLLPEKTAFLCPVQERAFLSMAHNATILARLLVATCSPNCPQPKAFGHTERGCLKCGNLNKVAGFLSIFPFTNLEAGGQGLGFQSAIEVCCIPGPSRLLLWCKIGARRRFFEVMGREWGRGC